MDTTPTSQPTPKKSNSTLNWAILVVVLVVAIAGVIYAIMRGDSTSNSNTPINTNTLVNSSSTTNVQVERVGNQYVISSLLFSFKIPGSWYTTEKATNSNSPVLFTASNENADSVLGIRTKETGVVVHMESEQYAGSLETYLQAKPTNVGKLIEQKTVTVGAQQLIAREVDATDVDSMEGSYSVAYFGKKDNYIIQILFVALTKGGIENNKTMIEEIINSYK